jgi:cytochrome P450
VTSSAPARSAQPVDPAQPAQPVYPARAAGPAEIPPCGPPSLDPIAGWQLTRHADVSAVLTDDRYGVPAVPPGEPGTIAGLRRTVARFSTGEPHARRRGLVRADLDRLDPDRLRQEARRVTGEELDRAAGTGRLDVMGRLARRVPVGVLAAGLGARDRERTVAAVARAAAAYHPGGADPHGSADKALRLLLDLLPAGPAELTANRIGLLIQACDATAGLIGNAVRHALRQPPTAPTGAILAEVLRHDPPVRLTRRVALAPADLAGTLVAAGTPVLLRFDSANRDPAVFPHPDRFDPTRDNRRVLTFGAGPRSCPANAQAIALAAGVFDALRDRCHLPDQPVVHEPSSNLRIPVNLEVVLR